MNTCFLFGHRDAPDDLRPHIETAVEYHYTKLGIRQFIVGGYGNFDRIAGSSVKAVKLRHPDIDLRLLLPYHPAERTVEVPPGFDGTFYPEGMESVPRKLAIVRANQYMVRNVDTVVCFVKHFGNTRALLEQARKRSNLYVQNLAEEIWFTYTDLCYPSISSNFSDSAEGMYSLHRTSTSCSLSLEPCYRRNGRTDRLRSSSCR